MYILQYMCTKQHRYWGDFQLEFSWLVGWLVDLDVDRRGSELP